MNSKIIFFYSNQIVYNFRGQILTAKRFILSFVYNFFRNLLSK